MHHKCLKPSNNCAFLIKHFLFLESFNKHEAIEDKFIPDGCMSIVFNFEGNVNVNNNIGCYDLPSFFVVFPNIQHLVIKTYPPLDSMVVVCKASVFTRIFKLNLIPYTNHPFIDGRKILSEQLWLEMKNNPNNRQKILEDFIISIYPTKYIPDDIDLAYEKIIHSKGETLVNELLKQADINPRSFRRRFLSRTGVNAKALSRLVRINYLWDCYLKGQKADFQSMVFEGNYYDQAHLIHDFKKIVGEAPSHFFNKEQANVLFLSGKVVQ